MPEPFKNLFNVPLIDSMGEHLRRVYPGFDAAGFIAAASEGLDELELKARSDNIEQALERFLPGDFATSAGILVASLDTVADTSDTEFENGDMEHGIRGWAVMPMADYIARKGQDHVEISLAALREMTMRFSSEFAIRPFLDVHKNETLKALTLWSRDKNHHVRRLVSEGSRPRLPWGMRLPQFITDPSPVIELLQILKDDPSEYVRRSVANNLNDIAKDHPDRVAVIAANWMQGASKDRQRLVRHGLRTLIKNGHPGALQALGYGPAKLILSRFEVLTPEVVFGNALEFELEISSAAESDQPLIIDYIVHHKRANGKTTPKVFKWQTLTLKRGSSLKATRRHNIKPITTRRYYPGQHRVEIMINGQVLAGQDFILKID